MPDLKPPPTLRLKPRHARPLFARHPWLYAGSLEAADIALEAGTEVRIESSEGQFVARGLFNPASALRVRLYRWSDQPLDEGFWGSRIDRALKLRRGLPGLLLPGAACRLVNSEGDGLSGLTADLFDRWLVVQPSSLALEMRLAPLIERLKQATGATGHVVRWDRWAAEHEGRGAPEPESSEPVFAPVFPINEGDLRFEINLQSGQKTGFYLDQRGNRSHVARLAPGRNVLDLFCYTGGFGLHALAAGANSMVGIDRSQPAIDQARHNAAINGLTTATFEVDEVAPAVRRLRSEGRRFGLVICDPPKFTRTAKKLDEALKGYVQLNRTVLELVEPGGFLVSCSCSGHVGPELFDQVVARSAELAGREVQILERRGSGPDHPIAASCLESDYLKCYILAVT